MFPFETLFWSWDSCCWSMSKDDHFPIVGFVWWAFLYRVSFLLTHPVYIARFRGKTKVFCSLQTRAAVRDLFQGKNKFYHMGVVWVQTWVLLATPMCWTVGVLHDLPSISRLWSNPDVRNNFDGFIFVVSAIAKAARHTHTHTHTYIHTYMYTLNHCIDISDDYGCWDFLKTIHSLSFASPHGLRVSHLGGPHPLSLSLSPPFCPVASLSLSPPFCPVASVPVGS